MVYKIKTLLLINLFTFCFFEQTAFAQSRQKPAKIKFSSAYTKLDDLVCQEENSSGENQGNESGHTAPLLCQGYKDYKVYLGFTCCQTMVYIDKGLKFETLSKQLGEPMTIGNEIKETVEWRLADGEPFACILRLEEDISIIDPGYKKQLNTYLVVISLKGYKKNQFQY